MPCITRLHGRKSFMKVGGCGWDAYLLLSQRHKMIIWLIV
ncbi:hypothetical protein CORMATOL_01249 [Corynebacterium matruchotii ATCC 33806]|uniref:Uncharacterized protein n=1 Tax=Corynebacterium matruchotii ATCC 33806 TaxID=566549 RepID=C0E2P4_9CORY|nr:hypothetical protein CORMATOL_01249 [Corynebacterium matruchotii ATCC 33806]